MNSFKYIFIYSVIFTSLALPFNSNLYPFLLSPNFDYLNFEKKKLAYEKLDTRYYQYTQYTKEENYEKSLKASFELLEESESRNDSIIAYIAIGHSYANLTDFISAEFFLSLSDSIMTSSFLIPDESFEYVNKPDRFVDLGIENVSLTYGKLADIADPPYTVSLLASLESSLNTAQNGIMTLVKFELEKIDDGFEYLDKWCKHSVTMRTAEGEKALEELLMSLGSFSKIKKDRRYKKIYKKYFSFRALQSFDFYKKGSIAYFTGESDYGESDFYKALNYALKDKSFSGDYIGSLLSLLLFLNSEQEDYKEKIKSTKRVIKYIENDSFHDNKFLYSYILADLYQILHMYVEVLEKGYCENFKPSTKHALKSSSLYSQIELTKEALNAKYDAAHLEVYCNSNFESGVQLLTSISDLNQTLDAQNSIYYIDTLLQSKVSARLCFVYSDSDYLKNQKKDSSYLEKVSSICEESILLNKYINDDDEALSSYDNILSYYIANVGPTDKYKKLSKERNIYKRSLSKDSDSSSNNLFDPSDVSLFRDKMANLTELVVTSQFDLAYLSIVDFKKALIDDAGTMEESGDYFYKDDYYQFLAFFEYLSIGCLMKKKDAFLSNQTSNQILNHIEEINRLIGYISEKRAKDILTGIVLYYSWIFSGADIYNTKDLKKAQICLERAKLDKSEEFRLSDEIFDEIALNELLIGVYSYLGEHEKMSEAIGEAKLELNTSSNITTLMQGQRVAISEASYFLLQGAEDSDFEKAFISLNEFSKKLEKEIPQLQSESLVYEIIDNFIITYDLLFLFQNTYNPQESVYQLERAKYRKLRSALGINDSTGFAYYYKPPKFDDDELMISFDIVFNNNEPMTRQMQNEAPIWSQFTDQLLTTLYYDYEGHDYVAIYPNFWANIGSYFGEHHPFPQFESYTINELIKIYRHYIKEKKDKNDESFFMLSRLLYDYFMKDLILMLKKEEKEVKKLVIVPDPVLGDLPFETLISPDGRYLIEDYDISYHYSKAIYQHMKDRIKNIEKTNQNQSLLAFGGARYNDLEISEGRSIDSQELEEIKANAYEIINSNSPLTPLYNQLGYTNFSNLPETFNEVTKIAQYFSNNTIVSGSDIKESYIKDLSESGELSKYNVIHFATHGLSVPEIPQLSALVLSSNEDGEEDNFLRVDEISKLNLNADFVNLSACNTGIGKRYFSEGVVGISSAFIVAGAKSLSMSLWPVDDTSTSIFMDNLYRTSYLEEIPIYDSMNRVKKDFINGEYGEAYKAPYYWAPFVFYGKK